VSGHHVAGFGGAESGNIRIDEAVAEFAQG
jgi:hypothetical protein